MTQQSKSRYRWLTRFAIVVFVLIAAIVGYFVAVTTADRHALEIRIEAIRQRGEPILPSDFVVPNADAPDNGGLLVDQAAERVSEYDEKSEA